MFSFINFLFFSIKYTFRNYSFLRILQIYEASNLNIEDKILDLGGNNFSHNISNFFNGKYEIQYADKFPKDENTIKVDLEIDDDLSQKYNVVCIMNILEHIKNYKNVINLCKISLNQNGLLIGSVPYMFKIHHSPNDYFRFSSQLIFEELETFGFKNIKIKPMGYGVFSNFYSFIFDYTKKIPLLNIFLITLSLLLDKLFFFVNKGYVIHYPIGYFFTANKI